ncbi:MAG: response regulator [Candidatus Methanomethylophilaceae archaeon]|nr:response regulator [Candidatus Methanomethylophilaceae archaeon]
MKVLIVYNNVDAQKNLRDMFESEGFQTRVASTVEQAVEKFSDFAPDVTFLAMSVDDGNGLSFIARAKEAKPSATLRVVLITSPGDHVPTDMPEIKCHIVNPFTAQRAMNALYNAAPPSTPKEKAPKKKRSFWDWLLRRGKDRIPAPVDEPSKSGVEFGSSYLIIETWPEAIYEFIGLFNTDEYSVMVITTEKPKAVREKFGYGNIDVRTMSSKPKAGMFDIHGLGTVIAEVREFINTSPKPVVVFDSLGEIAKMNGLNDTLKMLHLLIRSTEGVPRTVAVSMTASVDGVELSEKDYRIFWSDMKRFVPNV